MLLNIPVHWPNHISSPWGYRGWWPCSTEMHFSSRQVVRQRRYGKLLLQQLSPVYIYWNPHTTCMLPSTVQESVPFLWHQCGLPVHWWYKTPFGKIVSAFIFKEFHIQGFKQMDPVRKHCIFGIRFIFLKNPVFPRVKELPNCLSNMFSYARDRKVTRGVGGFFCCQHFNETWSKTAWDLA